MKCTVCGSGTPAPARPWDCGFCGARNAMAPRHPDVADQVREEWADTRATPEALHDEWAGKVSEAERRAAQLDQAAV